MERRLVIGGVQRSLLRSLLILVFFGSAVIPFNLPSVHVAAQEASAGDRLTDYDIDSLPGTGNKSARGVCSDGATLWVIEERALKLYAYSLVDDVPTRNEDGDIQLDVYENYGPGDCTSDGTTIWVADSVAFKLVAYDATSGARASDKDFDGMGAAGNDRFLAAANDSSTMWVADINDSLLYAYALADGARDQGKDISLHETGLSPVGIWTDGETMWVADNISTHVFAYELGSGSRDTDKEFAASDATNLQGIWSNSRVMWAANRQDRSDSGNKVLAYRMPVSASTDATLESLTLSWATLAPVFAAGTTAYTASVAHDVTQSTVSATASDGNASVVITPGDSDGMATGHQVNLVVGETTVNVVVTAEDGEATQTYTVSVTRAGSGDASLSALSLSGVTLAPVFAAGTTVYTASVAHDVTRATVSATTSYAGASVVVTPGDADGVAVGHQVDLGVGETTVSVAVTAEDGETTRTYSVTVTRAGSGDASLSGLSLSGVTLAPAFAAGTTAYTASVAHDVTQTTVSATASDGNASVMVTPGDSDGMADGHQVDLVVGETTVSVVVTAEDGEATQTYTVTVTRAGSGDASLSALSLSGVALAPAFASGTTAYTASVAHDVTQTTVSATASDGGASYEVRLNGVVDQDRVVPLAVGSNVIEVVVTAQDGETSQNYTVTVTRAGSSEASLSALSLSGVTLAPAFASETTAYTASVAHDVTETTVLATAADAGAAFEVRLNGVVDEDGIVPLAVGRNVIEVVVTAQDGETWQNYTVTVTRAVSGDASLSGLSLSGVTLSPAFAAGTTAYAASVAHDVTQTTVSATASDGNASVVITPEDADGVAVGHQVALAVGETTVSVVVTAEDGVTTRMYTVTVTRAGSSVASLRALSLSGVTLAPAFASETTTYAATVGNAVTQATVSVTASDGNASVVITPGDSDGMATGHQVDLAVGETTVSVVVTAQDGETSQTYLVVVTRAGSADASLSGLSLSGVMLVPAFVSGTTAYTASVAHEVTRATVSATAADAGASVAITPADADGVADGHQVDLPVGETTVSAVVTAEDGVTTRTYSVSVTRAGSADASLSGLSLSGVTLVPEFAAGTTVYTASVGNAVTETTVSATVADAGAAFEVRLNGVVDQDGIVPLVVGSNVISVVVTAQDGESTQAYSVTVTRAGSSVTSLSVLSLSGVTLTPVFASGTTAYTASVTHDVTDTTVSATAADAGAAFEVRLNGVVDQDGVVPLAVGSGNVISVVVTAQDGETSQTYSVTVTRAGSSVTSLSVLSLSGVTLTPVFASGTTAYTASVTHDVTETTVSATAADAGAAFEVRLNGVVDQDGVVPLAVGSGNVISVVVTAQDGETSQTYTVTVTRAGSADASLASLSVVGGAGTGLALDPPFTSSGLDYVALVAYRVERVTVAGVVGDPQASVTISPMDADAGEPGHQVDLVVGVNMVSLTVTAQDGETQATYVVRVKRQEQVSSLLESLEISRVTLTPVFSRHTLFYKAEVAHDAQVVTVAAVPEDDDATVVVMLDGEVDLDGALALGVGASVVQMVVTSRDGTAETTYTVAVTPAEEQVVPLPTPVRPSDGFGSRRSVIRPSPTPTPTVVPSGIGVSDSFLLMESPGLDGAPVEGTLEVWNRGAGRMVLNLADDVPWLKASPAFVVSLGPDDRKTVTLTAETWFLGAGSHAATVYVHVNDLEDSPKTISVVLAIAQKPTPTPTPSPTPTPTPSPTPTVAAPPKPTAVPTVGPFAAPPSPTTLPTPASSPTPDLQPTATPSPVPAPVPTAVPTPGAEVLVGSLEPQEGGDSFPVDSEGIEGTGVDVRAKSSVQGTAEKSIIEQAGAFTVLYKSPGKMDYRNPWSLFIGFFAIDIITKLRRKRDRFLD